MIKIILKSLGVAAIPFFLLSSGFLWGFVTRQMLDWHPLLIAAVLTSICLFGVALLLFTMEASYSKWVVIGTGLIAVCMQISGLSYLYEAREAKKVARPHPCVKIFLN